MIEVKRADYPERVRHHRKTGAVLSVIPAHYECSYHYNGREIARYMSINDCLMLKTDYIGHDFKRSTYDRALSCEYKDAYAELFFMLNVDKTSKISEYMNA